MGRELPDEVYVMCRLASRSSSRRRSPPMRDLVKATLVIENVFTFPGGTKPAVRVIPHNDDGTKPRGKASKGLLIVANEGETHADVLRTVAGYLEQEGNDWGAFTRERMADV